VTRAAILEMIARGQRKTWRVARTIVEAAPYLGFIDTETRVPWTSFALPIAPVDDVGAAYAALETLRRRFKEAGRQVRFELFDRYLADHQSVLEAAGFTVSGSDPLLALTADRFVEPGPGTIELIFEYPSGNDDTPRFLECVEASRLAFGPMPGNVAAVDEADAYRRDVGAGRLRLCAARNGRQVVSVASLVGVGDTVELAGVATVPSFRRRGAAKSVSAEMVRGFFQAGGRLVWLTAGSEEAERVYRSLGFVRVGVTQLNYEDTTGLSTTAET